MISTYVCIYLYFCYILLSNAFDLHIEFREIFDREIALLIGGIEPRG